MECSLRKDSNPGFKSFLDPHARIVRKGNISLQGWV